MGRDWATLSGGWVAGSLCLHERLRCGQGRDALNEVKCPVCSEPYPCRDVRPDRPNPYGWDRSLEGEPIAFHRIVSDAALGNIRATMDEDHSSAINPGCVCGLNKDGRTLERRKGYAKHGNPTGFCQQHQKSM